MGPEKHWRKEKKGLLGVITNDYFSYHRKNTCYLFLPLARDMSHLYENNEIVFELEHRVIQKQDSATTCSIILLENDPIIPDKIWSLGAGYNILTSRAKKFQYYKVLFSKNKQPEVLYLQETCLKNFGCTCRRDSNESQKMFSQAMPDALACVRQ